MIQGGITARDRLAELLPAIFEMMAEDCMFSVTDTEKFIAYQPGHSIDIRAKVGDLIPKQSPLYLCMHSQKAITKTVPREVWGTAFRSTATAIVDDRGRVVGAVGIGMSIERQSQMEQSYLAFSTTLQTISATSNAISSNMQQISNNSSEIMDLVHAATKQAKIASGMVAKVDTIADTTNILSINASVEAARAGQEGRSFAIVAQEIRKLSLDTQKVTNEIRATLDLVQTSVDTLASASTQNSNSIFKEIEALRSIILSIEEMQKIANKMVATSNIQ